MAVPESVSPLPIADRLEADRQALLDLSLRNPLLNYRPRARGLEFPGELSEQVVQCLVREGRRLTFLPAPEPPPKPATQPGPTKPAQPDLVDAILDLRTAPGPEAKPEETPEVVEDRETTPDSGGPRDEPDLEAPAPARNSVLQNEASLAPPVASPTPPAPDQTDHRLQSTLPDEPLQARLLSIYYAARASIEEHGVSALFLAAGMLKWTDPEHKGSSLRAPLVLVPVELERSSARERFRLRHSGEDLQENLSLAAKLKASFAIELPEAPEGAGEEVGRYLDAIAEAVAGQPGWSVDRTAVVLGFFSFGKFLMYRDLDPLSWPPDSPPESHRILKALLQDGFPASPAGSPDPDTEAATLDTLPPDQQPFCVMDADATQSLAIRDVSVGRDLVIQGPPGTGKSQTITNLIAGAIASGKTVLFVAEKLAALEVVKRRLDATGLGDACLELHSHKTSKRAVLEELERAYRLGKPRPGNAEDDLALLAETRDRLNAFRASIHGPVSTCGLSPYEAIAGLLKPETATRPDDAPPVHLDLPDWPDRTPIERKRRLALVAELQAGLASLGVPVEHPFWGCRKENWPPTETDRLRRLIGDAQARTAALQAAASALAATLRLEPATTRSGCALLLRAARRAAQSPGIDVTSPDWLTRRHELKELNDAGLALAAIHSKLDANLLPDAWEADLSAERQVLNIERRHWYRFLSPAYRRARRRVQGLYRGAPPDRPNDLIELLDEIAKARDLKTTIGRHEPLASRLYGPRWQGEKSSWESLSNLSKWAAHLHHDVRNGRVPAGLLAVSAEKPDPKVLRPQVTALKDALKAQLASIRAVTALLAFDDGQGPLSNRPFTELETRLKLWAATPTSLPALASFNRLAARCRKDGLGPAVDLAQTWPPSSTRLVETVERQGYASILSRAFTERPALAEFDSPGHAQAVRSFTNLDRLSLRHNRSTAASAHYDRLPRRGLGGGGQLGVLLREFEKKTRHLPVRQLLARAGNAVQAIKPVFLMSPLSVAAYLAPDGLRFDLVVFDEASQVRPVDALGALLRGGQAVVVGDSRQLPPTSFFDRLTGGDDRDPDDDATGPETADVESILGLFAASGAPERMLRWHYRSRHESLIAVANREFYENRLVVFPSPDTSRHDSGLILRRLPGTVYDRGATRTNPGEAEAVALAVMDHARAQLATPVEKRLTLGVAAFSVAQAGAILDRLEHLRADHPGCEPYFATGGAEPFFVKNLENVQGDERDVIFISVGYGRDSSGNLALGFGPLNAEGGERRLNVLITRARVRCEVFTNLAPEDIDPNRTRSRGVRALRTFLEFARSADTSSSTSNGSPSRPDATDADSPFESSLLAALQESGLAARLVEGEPGLAPELALADPDDPARSALGLITDGSGSRSSPPRPARDRERLRPQVLEGLGWRLHQVHALDWLRDPAAGLRQVQEALAATRKRAEPAPVPPAEPVESVTRDGPEEAEPAIDLPPSSSTPYVLATLDGEIDLATASRAEVARRLAEVVRIEGPIHIDEADRRVADGSGARRIGPRIQNALDEARAWAVAHGQIAQRADFLWPPDLDRPPIRDRSALPAASRKVELLPPEELAAAIETVVADSLGIPPDALPAALARLLGFPRVTDELRARVEPTVQALTESKRLSLRAGHLIADAPGA